MDAAVAAAREKLKNVTPLKKDCGRICGARCCRSLDGEETGMLLFPGEAEAYAGLEGWEVRETARGSLLLCPGTCSREERPLSCRLFPLLPLIGGDGSVRVVTDLRAKAVCPLARQGAARNTGITTMIRSIPATSGRISASCSSGIRNGPVTRPRSR